jgi:Zn-dependent M28 family amino/carboxypeptidase
LGIQGKDIYYGADDDGSGTSAILEIGQAFMEMVKAGHRPRRSIIIMPVSGEEKGLLGSKFFTMNSTVPMENIVADLNIDMIGRRDEKYKDDPDYVYVIGSDMLSDDLKIVSEKANEDFTKIKLDYTYDDPNDPNRFYYRSDHYNFAKNNIPVIFYFSGVHEDYHKPTDTFDKIEFEKMEKITRLVFYTAWELANREERIKLKEQKP